MRVQIERPLNLSALYMLRHVCLGAMINVLDKVQPGLI